MGVIVKPKNLNDRQMKRVDRIEESNPDRAFKVADRISARRDARGAENPQIAKAIAARRTMAQPMKKGGKIIKKAQNGILGGIKKKASEIKAKYDAFNKRGNDDAAYTKKTFKTADSLRSANPKVGPKGLRGMLDEKASNRRKADSLEKTVEKRVGVPRNMNLYENKNGGKIKKKAKNGSSFGMLSVKAGVDKNPKPTAADRIAGAKGLAKYGKMMKKGGKCKNGC
jgi:hypothetical protein